MKTKTVTNRAWAFVLQVVFVCISVSAAAQPDFEFRNAVLESGTDLQVGAVYRFTNVKPGIDGIITILDMTGGMTLNQLDGPSGFDEAFQPYINCPPQSSGYVEFKLDLVISGTNTPITVPEIPLTAIDIDGWAFPDDNLYETDAFAQSPEFFVEFDLLGTSLRVDSGGGWVQATNITAITYDGIDTLQKDVMFTAVHRNISSVIFRTGANNFSVNSMVRLRSVYFKRFYYGSGLLPLSVITSFQGSGKDGSVQLMWKLSSYEPLQGVELERSSDGLSFAMVKLWASDQQDQSLSNNFTDRLTEPRQFYRLKVRKLNGQLEYSRILSFQGKPGTESLKVYPNIVSTSMSLQFQSARQENISIAIYDMLGGLVQQDRAQVFPGINQYVVGGMDRLQSGTYIVQVKSGTTVMNSRFIKR